MFSVGLIGFVCSLIILHGKMVCANSACVRNLTWLLIVLHHLYCCIGWFSDYEHIVFKSGRLQLYIYNIRNSESPVVDTEVVTANSLLWLQGWKKAVVHEADNTQVAQHYLSKAASIFPGPIMQSQVLGLIVQIWFHIWGDQPSTGA